jgi:hypothetical protein
MLKLYFKSKESIMKKIVLASTLAFCLAASSFTQEVSAQVISEVAAGQHSQAILQLMNVTGLSYAGLVTAGLIVGGVIVGAATNSTASTTPPLVCPVGETLINGVCEENTGPEATCSGSDPLVNGVCTGTTTTLTSTITGTGTGTGTGTMTSTITVPVTFTYLPTL